MKQEIIILTSRLREIEMIDKGPSLLEIERMLRTKANHDEVRILDKRISEKANFRIVQILEASLEGIQKL
jgi:hypothetical protein